MRVWLTLIVGCSGETTPATTPTPTPAGTGDSTASPTDSAASSTIPLDCEAPPGYPGAGCCGDGVTCGCALQVMCDLGACDPLDAYLADHPTNPQTCLLTGLGPSYVAGADGSPSYHLKCEHPDGTPEDVVQRWFPSMANEVWVFGADGLQSLQFGGESGTYCSGTSPELLFGDYRPPVGCCEVRDPAVVDGCRFPVCE